MIQNDTLFIEQLNLKAKEISKIFVELHPKEKYNLTKKDKAPHDKYPSFTNIELSIAMDILTIVAVGNSIGIDVGAAVVKLHDVLKAQYTKLNK